MTTDNQNNQSAGIYSRVVDYINYWFTQTSPTHKFLDVLVVFVAVLLGGTLYFVWQRQDDFLTLAARSMEEFPQLHTERIDETWDDAWAAAQSTGAISLEIYTVDMGRNTRTLFRYAGVDAGSEKMFGPVGRTRAFLEPDASHDSLRVAAAMITGDPIIAPRRNQPQYTGLYVPIPDHPGRLLCGLMVATYRPDTPENDIAVARIALLGFIDEYTK